MQGTGARRGTPGTASPDPPFVFETTSSAPFQPLSEMPNMRAPFRIDSSATRVAREAGLNLNNLDDKRIWEMFGQTLSTVYSREKDKLPKHAPWGRIKPHVKQPIFKATREACKQMGLPEELCRNDWILNWGLFEASLGRILRETRISVHKVARHDEPSSHKSDMEASMSKISAFVENLAPVAESSSAPRRAYWDPTKEDLGHDDINQDNVNQDDVFRQSLLFLGRPVQWA